MPNPKQNVTDLLNAWGAGDKRAFDELVGLVYVELRRQASRYLRHESPGHTLQTTDLIHEAYLRLVDQKNPHWQNRAQFFGVAAQLMRRILVDFARARQKLKRGGGIVHVSLDDAPPVPYEADAELIALDDALQTLATFDQRKSRVIELRFFGGLSVEETAEALDVSPITVMRDWGLAKAWLLRELDRRHDA